MSVVTQDNLSIKSPFEITSLCYLARIDPHNEKPRRVLYEIKKFMLGRINMNENPQTCVWIIFKYIIFSSIINTYDMRNTSIGTYIKQFVDL